MQATATASIERELRIEASPETVYSYFVDPAKMAHWMASHAELDPRPGGLMRLDMNGFDIARGEFLELVPHSRIVFTWGWESLADAPRPGETRIEVTLTPDGDGTILKLVHSGLTEAYAGPHNEGWAFFLPRLASAAESGHPAEPRGEPLSEAARYASALNTLLCELREVLEGADPAAFSRRTSGSGWTAAVTASHIVSHLALAHFAVETAKGNRSPIADFTREMLDTNNAKLGEAPSPSPVEVLENLRADGPVAVDALKALDDASLANTQAMAFAGGAHLSARDVINGPLLGDMRAHVADVRAAVLA